MRFASEKKPSGTNLGLQLPTLCPPVPLPTDLVNVWAGDLGSCVKGIEGLGCKGCQGKGVSHRGICAARRFAGAVDVVGY